MNKRKYRQAGLLLAGAAAGLLGTAPAQAAGTATLSITAAGGGEYLITVSGQSPSSGQQSFSVSLYGDDQWVDEHLFGGTSITRGTSDAAGGYSIQFRVPGYTLNEDWGQDEVYAKVTLGTPSGTVVIRSNVVHGSY